MRRWMDMNRKRLFIAGSLVLTLILTAVFLKPAAAQDTAGKGRARMGIARLFRAQAFVRGLNLTADQKSQIKGILQNNKTQILQAARDVVKARLDAAKGLPDAAAELANAQIQAANLRKQILEQIKPVLTADQLARVQERIQLREQRLQRVLDRLNSRIGG
jgi:Spy/CpxP family protein refolding chaperone